MKILGLGKDRKSRVAEDRKKEDYRSRPETFGYARILSSIKVFTGVYAAITLALLLLLNYLIGFIGSVSIKRALAGGAISEASAQQLLLLPDMKYLPFYLVYALLAVIIYFYYLFHLRLSFAGDRSGHKGTQRFTTRRELKAQYKEIPLKGETFAGGGGFPVAETENTIFIDTEPVNNLVIGTTRSGKGELIVFKMVDLYSRSETKPTMIITDPKLEIAPSAIPILKARGYEYHVLNLIDPLYGMLYNPIAPIVGEHKIGNVDDAQLLAGALCYSIFCPTQPTGEDKYFTDTSTCLLTGLILALIKDALEKDALINMVKKAEHEGTHMGESSQPTYVSTNENEKKLIFYSIITMFITLATTPAGGEKTELDVFFDSREEDDPSRLLYYTAGIAGDRQKGNVYSSTIAALRVFLTNSIAKMTASSSVDMLDIGFGEKPMVIFLALPDYNKANWFLATAFINQLYFLLAKTCAHVPGGKLPRELLMILDEFGNMPAIDDMATKATVCLGRGFRFTLIVQSYAQIKEKYGEEGYKTIKGNCGNTLFIQSADADTAEEFSEMLGERTVFTMNRSGSALQVKKQYTESEDSRRLLDKNELMNLMPGETVLFRAMKRTDRSRKGVRSYPIYNDPENPMRFRYEYMLDDFPQTNVLYPSPELERLSEGAGGDTPGGAMKTIASMFKDSGKPLSEQGCEIESTKDVSFRDLIWSRDSYFKERDVRRTPVSEACSQADIAKFLEIFSKDIPAEALEEMKSGEGVQVGQLICTAERMYQYESKRPQAIRALGILLRYCGVIDDENEKRGGIGE